MSMPFELIAYRPRGRPPVTTDEVDKILSALAHFKRADSSGDRAEWQYLNADTGVHFAVWFDPDRKSPPHLEWNDSPLAITVGLGKPSYFGYESFLIVEQVLKNLNLAALDPQKNAVYKQPAKLTADQMRTSWEKSNEEESQALIEAKKSVAFAPREKMDAFWRFMHSRPALQETLGPEVLVPTINLHRGKDGAVKTSCIWPDAAKVAMPEVDYVLVQREERKLMSKKRVSGAVPYSKIETLLKPRSTAKAEPVKHLLFDRDPDKELLESLSELTLEPAESLPKLTPDDIVDAKN